MQHQQYKVQGPISQVEAQDVLHREKCYFISFFWEKILPLKEMIQAGLTVELIFYSITFNHANNKSI